MLTRSGRGRHRVGCAAWTSTRTSLAHQPEWDRLEELTAAAPADRRRGRRARSSSTSGWRPTCRWCARPRRTRAGHLPVLAARPGARAVGRRAHLDLARPARLLHRRFPAALYRARWWWLATTAVANVVARRADRWWLLDHPERARPSLLTPAEVDRLVEHDFADYYTEYPPATSPPRSGSTTPGWPRSASPSACSGCRCSTCCSRTSPTSAVIGCAHAATTAARLFFGLILPHGLLELTAVFVAGGVGLRLFWSWVEPGRPHPGASRSPQEGRTAGRGGARPGRRCCSSAACIEAFVTRPAADLGPDRRSAIVAEAGVPRLRLRPRAPRPCRAGRRPATSTPALLERPASPRRGLSAAPVARLAQSRPAALSAR